MTSTDTTSRTYDAVRVNWPASEADRFPSRTTFQAAGTELSTFAADRGATAQPVKLTVSVGQDVQVWAYGRPRPGVVTGLGPKRIQVEFQQNAQGTRSSRKFAPADLLAGGTPADAVKVPTPAQVGRMTDDQLQATADTLEAWRDAIEAAGDPDDQVDAEITDALIAIEREQDNRADWNSDDDRIREAVGNPRHDDTPALHDVMAIER